MKPVSSDQIYIVMSGISRKTCRYRFTIKFTESAGGDLYKWERIPVGLDEYAGRAIFRRDGGFSFYNSYASTKDFILDEIWGTKPYRTVVPFTDYSSIELSFPEITEIVENHYSDYYNALSAVKGIYMLIDGNTGKLYVGSAYGSDGIWGRWSSYAYTCHGDNADLVDIYDHHGREYFDEFKFIVLQVLPMTISEKEIIEIESMYKNRFLTRQFGLNRN